VIGHSVREIFAALVLLASTVPEVLARGLAPTAAIDLGVLINMSPTGDPDIQVARPRRRRLRRLGHPGTGRRARVGDRRTGCGALALWS
jgi:hypothetical protein